jgi:hypothetical protein
LLRLVQNYTLNPQKQDLGNGFDGANHQIAIGQNMFSDFQCSPHLLKKGRSVRLPAEKAVGAPLKIFLEKHSPSYFIHL